MTSGYNDTGSALSWPQNGAAWIEQELSIEPHQFPVQYTLTEKNAGENGPDDNADDVVWTVSITADAVTVKRQCAKIAHLPREIALADFSDVVLWGALSFNEAGDVMVGLSLYSQKHDLQVPVCITADTDGLAARWTDWSATLGLMPKVLDGKDDLRDPFQGVIRLTNVSALPRRMPGNRLARGAWTDGGNVCQLNVGRTQPRVQQPN